MSLKLIMADDAKFINFSNKIENETGVQIGPSETNSQYWGSVIFPDNTRINVRNDSLLLQGDVYNHVFIDVDNHLFMYRNIDINETNIKPNNNLSIPIFICETTDGRVIDAYSGASPYSSLFNIPDNAQNDASKQSITIFPCYYNYDNMYTGFLKNIYINYERNFVAGLKFVDENNNEFITLGGYLLYKNN